MTVGQKLIRTPCLFNTFGHRDGVPQECTVVYVHPQRRFYTVEFTSQYGLKFRQSYYFEDRQGPAGEEDEPNENDSDFKPERWGGKNRHGGNYGPRFGGGPRKKSAAG